MVILHDFIARVRSSYSGQDPDRANLLLIGNEMKAIVETSSFDEPAYRLARSGEALMYEINVDPHGGASLYLVSDGVGVDTMPHEHQTWAIIIGIKGAEFNTFHQHAGTDHGLVTRLGDCLVGEGDVLVMEAHHIHAIDSRLGNHPTCHIHLYGRSLASLPHFDHRCFTERK